MRMVTSVLFLCIYAIYINSFVFTRDSIKNNIEFAYRFIPLDAGCCVCGGALALIHLLMGWMIIELYFLVRKKK